MIIRNIALAAILGACALLCYPQASFAGDASSVIRERLWSTAGMEPTARSKALCEGIENTKLCEKLASEPEYRTKYFRVADLLAERERQTADALANLKGEIDRKDRVIQALIARAPKLPDGRAIFRKSDGTYVDEQGAAVAKSDVQRALASLGG